MSWAVLLFSGFLLPVGFSYYSLAYGCKRHLMVSGLVAGVRLLDFPREACQHVVDGWRASQDDLNRLLDWYFVRDYRKYKLDAGN